MFKIIGNDDFESLNIIQIYSLLTILKNLGLENEFKSLAEKSFIMNLNVAELLDKYLEFIIANKNLSKNTLVCYKNDIIEYLRFANVQNKSDLVKVELNLYIEYLAKNFSTKTHCRKLSSIKNFYKYLFEKKQSFVMYFQI